MKNAYLGGQLSERHAHSWQFSLSLTSPRRLIFYLGIIWRQFYLKRGARLKLPLGAYPVFLFGDTKALLLPLNLGNRIFGTSIKKSRIPNSIDISSLSPIHCAPT